MNERSTHAPQPDESLSPAGIARRKTMLAELDASMARRNFQRRAVPISAAAALIAVAAFVAISNNRGTRGVNTSEQIAVAPTPIAAARSTIQIVPTDPSILSRLSVAAHASIGPARVQMIDDAELQEMLRAVGQPDGLVRVGGRTRVASEVVPRPDGDKPADAG